MIVFPVENGRAKVKSLTKANTRGLILSASGFITPPGSTRTLYLQDRPDSAHVDQHLVTPLVVPQSLNLSLSWLARVVSRKLP